MSFVVFEEYICTMTDITFTERNARKTILGTAAPNFAPLFSSTLCERPAFCRKGRFQKSVHYSQRYAWDGGTQKGHVAPGEPAVGFLNLILFWYIDLKQVGNTQNQV